MLTLASRMPLSGRRVKGEISSSKLVDWWAAALVIFLVLFPKGGFKIGAVPLTWGYLLLGLTGIGILPFWAVRTSLRISWLHVLALGSLLPFQLLLIYSLLVNGTSEPGYAISTFVSIFLLPVFFLILIPPFLGSPTRLDNLLSTLRVCMFLAAVYGIFLFFWHIAFGHFLQIPYITVNAADIGELATTKHIDRGGIFKLISTYNNGNVYGAATLILLPIYDKIEPKRWHKLVVRLALFLTLSRSVWIGLIALQFLYLMGDVKRDWQYFPFIRVGKSVASLALLIPVAIAVGFGMILMATDLGIILDSSFGGRAPQLQSFLHTSFFPSIPVGAIREIVYASAAGMFGYAGLLAFILLLAFPIVIYLTHSRVHVSMLNKAALTGLLVYAVMCGMDGAFNYIPVMAFYWFAYMMFLNNNRKRPSREGEL